MGFDSGIARGATLEAERNALRARIAELEALLGEAQVFVEWFKDFKEPSDEYVELRKRIDAALGTENPSSHE